jgi:hypothetical protein
MPKKVSVKTVDGNRYDRLVRDEMILESGVPYTLLQDWLSFVDGSTRKFFYVPNIVSITETEVEDGETN